MASFGKYEKTSLFNSNKCRSYSDDDDDSGNERVSSSKFSNKTYKFSGKRKQPYGGFSSKNHTGEKKGYFTKNYNSKGNNVQAGKGYTWKSGGKFSERKSSDPCKPYAKFVINPDSCIRVCYMNGQPMVRLSDSVDLDEKRGPKKHVEKLEVSKPQSRTIFLTVGNFCKLLSKYKVLKNAVYKADEKKIYLGTESTDQSEILANLYKVDNNPSVSACNGELTFQSYYTAAGNNQMDTWSVVYAKVVIPGSSVSMFEEILPEVESQLTQMPPGDHAIIETVFDSLTVVMLQLLSSYGPFQPEEMTVGNEKFMHAYFACHEELQCAGYISNIIKDVTSLLEEQGIKSPLDLFSTVFQLAGNQTTLIKYMQTELSSKITAKKQ
jgi:hypothetical protein